MDVQHSSTENKFLEFKCLFNEHLRGDMEVTIVPWETIGHIGSHTVSSRLEVESNIHEEYPLF